MTELVRAGERVDDLQYQDLRLIQQPSAFCFGMGAVLLASFATLRPREKVADMGTGTGILPVLLSAKEKTATFHAFEIQPDMAEMASRSMALNGLADRVTVYARDMAAAPDVLGREGMDAVVCNPPYGKKESTLQSENEGVRLARHEGDTDLEHVVAACAAVLRTRGKLFMVFPAPRMLELMDALREKRLEPKRLRMVCAKADKAPYLLLVEAIKNAKPQLLWLPPLIVYQPDGTPTRELDEIYHRC